MSVILSVLIILCCIVLILAVLVQNPKGGGLASGFSSGAQVMGVRRTADFLEKATWTLAVLLFVFSIATAARPKGGTGSAGGSQTKGKAEEVGNAGQQQNAPNNTASPFGPGAGAPTPPPAGGGK